MVRPELRVAHMRIRGVSHELHDGGDVCGGCSIKEAVRLKVRRCMRLNLHVPLATRHDQHIMDVGGMELCNLSDRRVITIMWGVHIYQDLLPQPCSRVIHRATHLPWRAREGWWGSSPRV